ncbi:MAG: ORF6N domain-containing protein [Alphaproteobacteria bacterium]|nr:ORF6N domain-containing protein [Alphaproteobacteria bacterium]
MSKPEKKTLRKTKAGKGMALREVEQHIEQAVYVVRGHRVMLDADLAALYQVETKVLNQAVQRNVARFPEDFMFQLNDAEALASRSQFVTLNKGRGHNIKYLPYAFTEQGIAMLSSVLRSERAVAVNIEIMRAFVKMRKLVNSQAIIKRDIDLLKHQFKDHDQQLRRFLC